MATHTVEGETSRIKFADRTRYYTAVVETQGTKWLCLIAVEHGSWLSTAHKDDKGGLFWYYQGPLRQFKSFHDQIKWPENTPFDALPNEIPTVEEAAKAHKFEI